MPQDEHELMTSRGIAELLGVSPQRVRQIVAAGGFPEPSLVHGEARFWRTAEVVAWADQNRPPAPRGSGRRYGEATRGPKPRNAPQGPS